MRGTSGAVSAGHPCSSHTRRCRVRATTTYSVSCSIVRLWCHFGAIVAHCKLLLGPGRTHQGRGLVSYLCEHFSLVRVSQKGCESHRKYCCSQNNGPGGGRPRSTCTLGSVGKAGRRWTAVGVRACLPVSVFLLCLCCVLFLLLPY